MFKDAITRAVNLVMNTLPDSPPRRVTQLRL